MVALEPDVGFPLPFEVTLFGSDALGGSDERIAAEILVPLLHETEPGLVPDEPVHHQFFERGVDVALALEQLIPNRHAAARITHDAHRTADPMVDAERIVALKQAQVSPLMPAEQSTDRRCPRPPMCRCSMKKKSAPAPSARR